MKKVAVLLSQGFEECEALTTVDVLRRAGLTCDMVGVEAIETTGSHGISVLADRTLTEDMDDYDMVVLPGGLPGAEHLRDDARVIALLRRFDAQGKFIAAICAAPMALKAAGVTDGRAFTSYPGARFDALFAGDDYREENVVRDGHVITSRGPATTLAFAYALVEALGTDAGALREGMLYSRLMQSRQTGKGECVSPEEAAPLRRNL
jgi:4-methyl-5(b-hydroxyethyl)-thiazole monophosphate biosynthesis